MSSPNRIVCAAIKCRHTGLVICGVRRFDKIMCQQIEMLADQVSDKFDQGFVDKFGNYHSRISAWYVAVNANQIIRQVGSQSAELYSENLY